MQTVTADEINSRNKQKSSQLQTNLSRKFKENKREEKRIIVKMQTVIADAINSRNNQKSSNYK